MPVVDASVLVEYLAGAEGRERARARLLQDRELWSPHLVDAEVGHVLRRAVASAELTARVAAAALDDLAAFPLRRAAHLGLLDRAWALRKNVTFYDALYLALAERLDMPLLTFDRRLAAVPQTAGRIELLGRE